jgi:hypothetical protein
VILVIVDVAVRVGSIADKLIDDRIAVAHRIVQLVEASSRGAKQLSRYDSTRSAVTNRLCGVVS